MDKSLVVQAAIAAFATAKVAPHKQPSLAAQRSLQPELFDDIEKTLISIPNADDLTVYADGQGKQFRFRAKDLMDWIARYPSGAAFPITVAASVEAGSFPAPMRVLLMVPLDNGRLLNIPNVVARHYVEDIWPGQ